MEISAQAGGLARRPADTIVVNLFQGVTQPCGATGALDEALERGHQPADRSAGLHRQAQPDRGAVPGQGPRRVGRVQAPRVILVGLGKRDELTLDRVRQVAATAARRARELGSAQVATVLHGAGTGDLAPRQAAQALAEGSLLGLYRFDQLKGRVATARATSRRRAPARETRARTTPGGRYSGSRWWSRTRPACRRSRRGIAPGAHPGREHQLRPRPGHPPRQRPHPARTLAAAEEMAGSAGLRCQVLGPEEMAELKMGALLGVAQGSEEPARFIIVEHRPEGAEGPPVVLCGKGITFDTGGISIKPGEGMWAMKDDMAGGAAVLGALRALALLDVRRPAVALVAASRTCPAGTPSGPGTSCGRWTGRRSRSSARTPRGASILADALAYGQRYSPWRWLDVATLTGGVITALGHGAPA